MADNKKLINVEGLSKVATGLKGYVDKKDGAMNTRMQAVEGAKHTHDNAEELAKVVDGKVAAWDAKAEVKDVQDAQAAAEGKAAELVKGLQEGAVAKNTTDLRSAEGRLATLEGLVVGGEGEGIAAILADVEALKTAVGDDKAGLVADMDDVQGRMTSVEGVASQAAADITVLQGEMDAAEGRLDGLEGRMTTVEGKAADNAAAIEALQGRATAVEGFETRIAANEAAIATLNGEGEGSVKQAVAQGIASVVADAHEDFDTLKEVADWIMSDTTGAAAMQTQVAANKDAIAVLNGDGVGSVTKAVAGEAELRAAQDEILEGKITAEATARENADNALGGRIDGVITRIESLEGVDLGGRRIIKKNGISAAKVQAWDGKAEVADVQAAQQAAATAQAAAEAADGKAVAAQGTADQAVAAAGVADGKAVAAQADATQALADAAAAQTQADKGVQDAATAQQAAVAASGKVDTLRTDMVAVFNALDLQYEENKIKLVLPDEQAGVTTPLGEVELPVLTADEADALVVELGLGE